MNISYRLVSAFVLGIVLTLPTAQAAAAPAPFTREELRVYVERMDKGDLQAYFEIGAAMLRGDRLAHDVAGGLEKLTHAADRGHLDASLMLVAWYHYNNDVEKARTYLQRALATGDPRAHHGFVQLLDKSMLWRLFPDDAEKERRRLDSLTRAANGNIPDAMHKLGMHYSDGKDEDPARSFHWFEQGAMNGHEESIAFLARLLVDGAPSEWRAASEHLKAPIAKVASRNPAAGARLRFELGGNYDRAGGSDASSLAAHYYTLVSNDEKADGRLRYLAQLRYARLAVEFGAPESREEALTFFNNLATGGSAHAQCFLASEMHEKDGLLPHDAAAAKRWETQLRATVLSANGLPASCGTDVACQIASENAVESICDEMYGS